MTQKNIEFKARLHGHEQFVQLLRKASTYGDVKVLQQTDQYFMKKSEAKGFTRMKLRTNIPRTGITPFNPTGEKQSELVIYNRTNSTGIERESSYDVIKMPETSIPFFLEYLLIDIVVRKVRTIIIYTPKEISGVNTTADGGRAGTVRIHIDCVLLNTGGGLQPFQEDMWESLYKCITGDFNGVDLSTILFFAEVEGSIDPSLIHDRTICDQMEEEVRNTRYSLGITDDMLEKRSYREIMIDYQMKILDDFCKSEGAVD